MKFILKIITNLIFFYKILKNIINYIKYIHYILFLIIKVNL